MGKGEGGREGGRAGEESNKPGNGKICRLIGAGTEGWRQRRLETFMIGHTTTSPPHHTTELSAGAINCFQYLFLYRNCLFTIIDEITYIIYLKISILLTFSKNLLSRKLWSCYRLVQLLTNIFQEMIIVLSVRENYNYSQNPHISHIVTVGRAELSEGSKIGLTETRSDQIWAQEEITLSEGISQPSIQFVKTNSPPSLPQRSYQTFSVERGRYWYCPNDPDWTGKLLFFHLVVNILQNSFLYFF